MADRGGEEPGLRPASARSSDAGEADGPEAEHVCRICRCPAEPPSRELFHPCRCSGSIKFVHQDCLMQWLTHSGRRHCEVCKYEFSFTPVYADGVPPTLPLGEVLLGLAARGARVVARAVRAVFVVAVWLMWLPSVTCSMGRLAFSRSVTEVIPRLGIGMAPLVNVSDCIQGLTMAILIVALFASLEAAKEWLHGHFGAEADEDGEAAEGLGAEEAPGRGEHEAEAEEDEDAAALWEGNQEADAGPAREGEERVGPPGEDRPGWAAIARGEIFADAPGAADMALEDVLGIHRPLYVAVEHASMMAVFNALIIGQAVAVPFMVGRAAVALLGLANARLRLGIQLVEWLQDLTERTPAAELLADPGRIAGITAKRPRLVALYVMDEVQAQLVTPALPDLLLLLVGYSLLASAVLALAGGAAARRLATPEGRRRWSQRFAWASAACRRATAGLVRGALEAGSQVLVVAKVLCILLLERGVVPVLMGAWLDLCAMEVLGGGPQQRSALLRSNPLAVAGIYWFAGLGYMLYFTSLSASVVSLLRPEAIPGGLELLLRVRADEDPDALGAAAEEHFGAQLMSTATSFVAYATSMVVLVHLPVQAVHGCLEGFFPWRQRLASPPAEVSMDILLFHVVVPLLLEHLHGAGGAEAAARCARKLLRALANALALQHLLRPEEGEEPVAGEGGPGPSASTGSSEGGARSAAVGWAQRQPLRLRYAAGASLAAGALLAAHGLALVMPVAAGRVALRLAGLPGRGHDLYAGLAGLYGFLLAGRACQALWPMVHVADVCAAAASVLRWAKLTLMATGVFAILVGVCPLLLGVLLELLMLPARVSANKSPILFLYQDWVLGLLCLKLWHRVVMAVPLPEPGAGWAALRAWRLAFEDLQHGSLCEGTVRRLWAEITRPVLFAALTALAGPYALAHGLIPAARLLPDRALPLVWLYCYHAAAAAALLAAVAAQARRWVSSWLQGIRDERYLITRQLNNFSPEVSVASAS